MADRQTGSIWSHLDGLAMQGSLQGTEMEIIPLLHTTWEEWVELNPDTWIELLLAIYFAVATSAAIAAGLWAAVPFLLLFEAGYAYTAIATLVQSARRGGLARRRGHQGGRT